MSRVKQGTLSLSGLCSVRLLLRQPTRAVVVKSLVPVVIHRCVGGTPVVRNAIKLKGSPIGPLVKTLAWDEFGKTMENDF